MYPFSKNHNLTGKRLVKSKDKKDKQIYLVEVAYVRFFLLPPKQSYYWKMNKMFGKCSHCFSICCLKRKNERSYLLDQPRFRALNLLR